MNNSTKANLLSIWSTQDQLLQSYRALFLTFESVLLAGASIILTSGPPWLSIVVIVLGLLAVKPWKEICSNRARDVSFIQWLLLKNEAGAAVPTPFTTFKEFQADRENYEFGGAVVSQDASYQSSLKSPTRRHLDDRLPKTVRIIFSGLLVFAILISLGIVKMKPSESSVSPSIGSHLTKP